LNLINAVAINPLAGVDVWSQALWFTAGIFGTILVVAIAAMALEIAFAASETHRAPGAEFMGLSKLTVRTSR
jgi:hypothetical protein